MGGAQHADRAPGTRHPPEPASGRGPRGRARAAALVCAAALGLPAPALADNLLPEVAPELDLSEALEDIEPDAFLPVLRMGLIQHHDDLRGRDLHRVMRQKLPHVVHCTDRLAQAGMPLQGTLHLTFVLLADGTAQDLEVNLGRMPLPELEDCLHPLVARWPLPADERLGALDVQVDYLVGVPEVGFQRLD